MNKDADRRGSFRVAETALVNYEVLDEDDFAAGIARWRLRAGEASHTRSKLIDLDARLDELMFRATSESPAASEVLRLLNDKINLVTQALPEFEQTQKKLAKKTPQNCQLSSDGMLFGVDENLPENAGLALQFMVLPDNRYFETLARVTRAAKMDKPDMGSYKYLIAVRFHGMSPAERDNLIQHLFTQQSESLRLRRKNLENNNEQ